MDKLASLIRDIRHTLYPSLKLETLTNSIFQRALLNATVYDLFIDFRVELQLAFFSETISYERQTSKAEQWQIAGRTRRPLFVV